MLTTFPVVVRAEFEPTTSLSHHYGRSKLRTLKYNKKYRVIERYILNLPFKIRRYVGTNGSEYQIVMK